MAFALYLLALILAYVGYAVFKFYREVATFPKGPKPWPVVGNLLQVSHYESSSFLDCRCNSKPL